MHIPMYFNVSLWLCGGVCGFKVEHGSKQGWLDSQVKKPLNFHSQRAAQVTKPWDECLDGHT